MRAARLVPIGLMFLGLAALAFAAAKEKAAQGDRWWTTPDIKNYPVASIAMLPPATYDGNVDSRKQVELAVGQALKGSGHRWVSPFLVRDDIVKNGGDSLAKALNDKILKDPRLDSLDAPRMSRLFHARALLTVRVDEMERRELEADQSGRPTTSIRLRAALVDSTGRLLWTMDSNETMEGPPQDANANIIGMKVSGLNNTPVGNISAAPAYPEVLSKMCARWTDVFPKRAAPDSSGSK